jgi:putative DNA primase/helicase
MVMIIAHDPVDRFLGRLHGVKPVGPQAWKGFCPAHDDQNNRSLSVKRGGVGKLLVYCHAGCSYADIMGAVERTPVATVRDDRPMSQQASRDQVDRYIPYEAEYPYHDANGTLAYVVRRYANPKAFRPFLPGSHYPGLKGCPKLLYRLPELLAAEPGSLVLYAEGEKDVDRLRSLGFVATTAGNATSWDSHFTEHFRGLQVAILPDNDDAGYKHAEDVAASLVGIAVSVKVVVL